MATTIDRPALESNDASESRDDKTRPFSHFYRVIWRWHFYAGLLVIPVVVILSITGIIRLFKPQIEQAMYGNLMQVVQSGPALSYSQQLESAEAAYPDATPTGFRPSDAADRAAEVGLKTADGRDLTAYVDPYTGLVKGDRIDSETVPAIAEKIHGTLLIGTVGDYIVELVACWALVLVLTGLYLWFPRKRSAFWGALLPRLRARGRTLWRDVHALTGFYGSLLVLFMILTGLPWTGFWGNKFSQVWNQYPSGFFDAPKSTVLTGSLNQDGSKIIPWAAEQLPIPLSSTEAGHEGHGGSTASSATAPTARQAVPLDLDSVIGIAEANGIHSGYNIRLPQDPEGVYTFSLFGGDLKNEVVMHIDQYSGDVLANVGWEQFGTIPKVVENGISIHTGERFGVPNQLLMLATTLGILVLTVTAPVMWWTRRPAGRLGAPAMPRNFPLWKGAVAIMIILGVMFPLLGASLLAVLLLDFLVIRRIPVLQRTFV